MTRAGRIAISALLFLLLGSGVAWAKEFYESYDEGLKAVESKEWSVVVAKMTEAIRKNPKENKRERSYGANFFPYHPYYYRGIAYFNQGKYPEAIDDLQKALGVGRINLGTSESWIVRAEERMRYSAPPTATQQPTTTQPTTVPTQQPPTTTQAPVIPPTTTRPPVTQQPPVTTTRPPVTTPSTRPPVTTTPAVVTPVAATNPGVLKAKVRDALRAYFNGDFQRSEIALELLSKEQESNAMIWAFLGASKFNSFILSGESNTSMKSGAEDAFRRARQLRPSMQLNAKYFSPRVRNFYESID